MPLCVHVPSSSEELSPDLIRVSAWDLNHNRGLAPLSNHFKAALAVDGAGVAQKNRSCSDTHELRKLVDHDHPDLSVSRQCELLGLPRSTLYYRPPPVRQSTLQIMARIDASYLEDPCSGSRRMVDYLAREGIPISRDRGVRNLTRRMGLRAIYQKPRTTAPGQPSERFPCLVRADQKSCGSWGSGRLSIGRPVVICAQPGRSAFFSSICGTST